MIIFEIYMVCDKDIVLLGGILKENTRLEIV